MTFSFEILRVDCICLMIIAVAIDQEAVSLQHLGLVVQSIISLISSFRGQLVKCFMTL